MQRGYTLLWRKIWTNPLLCDPGRRFSRLEAWLYIIINVLAAGLDDENTGLKRGEFIASIRFLVKPFNWSHAMAQRFIDHLAENSMITRVIRESIHSGIQEAGHFVVGNCETHNQSRYGKQYAERYNINEVEKKNTHVPSGDGNTGRWR